MPFSSNLRSSKSRNTCRRVPGSRAHAFCDDTSVLGRRLPCQSFQGSSVHNALWGSYLLVNANLHLVLQRSFQSLCPLKWIREFFFPDKVTPLSKEKCTCSKIEHFPFMKSLLALSSPKDALFTRRACGAAIWYVTMAWVGFSQNMEFISSRPLS